MRQFRTIVETDVGHVHFQAFGRVFRTSDFIGRILSSDIGKRVYLVLPERPSAYGDIGILQVESNEQRTRRIAG